MNDLGKVLSVERALTGKDLVQNQSQRVDIALGGDLLAGELLGGHVGRRAGADGFP